MLEEIHRYRETIQVDPGRSASVADTQTQELIAAFETDLDASYRFHDLSLQLAAVRERIASGCTSCAAPGTAPQERPYQHSHESRQSDDLLGSVFSTGGHR